MTAIGFEPDELLVGIHLPAWRCGFPYQHVNVAEVLGRKRRSPRDLGPHVMSSVRFVNSAIVLKLFHRIIAATLSNPIIASS